MTLNGRLYHTPALPTMYVAEDENGNRWMVPVSPIGRDALKRRRPYKGNYTLEPVMPAVAKFYLPPAGEAWPDTLGPGRPPKAPEQKAVMQNIRFQPEDLAAIDQAAERRGVSRYQYIVDAAVNAARATE